MVTLLTNFWKTNILCIQRASTSPYEGYTTEEFNNIKMKSLYGIYKHSELHCIYGTPTQLLFSLKVQTFLFSVLIKVFGIDAVTHHPISPLVLLKQILAFF